MCRLIINSSILLQGGSGSASNIKFQNIEMHDVDNPIIINQKYCDDDKPCESEVWKLKPQPWIFTNKTNIINPQLIVHDFPNTNGFVAEPGGSSAKCVVPEHQRNKFFK